MATEAQRRLAGINATGSDGVTFLTRIQYFLAAAYLDLATIYHHFELDVIDTTTITLSTSTNTVTLPADCHEVIALSLRNGTTYVGEVGIYSQPSLLPAYTAAVGVPTRRARFAGKLYFDKKPDIAYACDLYYYKRPALPDFTGSDSPLTAVDVDEHIIEYALSLANPAIGRPDLMAVNRQLLSDWLASQIRPSLQDPLERRERPETDRAMGGAQG